MPEAVLKSTFSIGFSMVLVIFTTLACDNRDIDAPESNITSRLR